MASQIPKAGKVQFIYDSAKAKLDVFTRFQLGRVATYHIRDVILVAHGCLKIQKELYGESYSGAMGQKECMAPIQRKLREKLNAEKQVS